MATVTLRKGRGKPVRNRHPWVYSGAIERIDGPAQDGELVEVLDHRGDYLATGYLNRGSQIAVRLLAWDASIRIDAGFLRQRLEEALARRAQVAADPATNAYRLVHAESDGLPGLIVDRYAGWIVIQCLTLGIDRRRDEIAQALGEMLRPRGVYARNDAEVRQKEGLPREQLPLWGDSPGDREEIVENGHRFIVDIKRGHKTGFYLDQRANRLRTAAYCSGAQVLNAFGYTGAFAVYAALAGAESVVSVDTSYQSLVLAEENLALNGCLPQEMVAGDAFEVLRDYRHHGKTFDVVILDPPKFAYSQSHIQAASRGYKDLNMLAMQLLAPGGKLVTFSCSGLLSADLFQKIVFGASVDAGRDLQIVERLFQSPDHPVRLTFPESAYLKGFICQAV